MVATISEFPTGISLMSTLLRTLTLALDRYDRHLPLMLGAISPPDGYEVDVLEVGQHGALRHGEHRHERMLRDREFSAAEVSLSSFLIAADQGVPVTGIPVFPRRLFSQTQMFVNADAGISTPKDLEGRRVGLQSFQTTLALLAKGDLKFVYGVDLTSIDWRLKHEETLSVDVGAFSISQMPAGRSPGELLASGEIDALLYSRTPEGMAESGGKIRRLFDDPRAETKRVFAADGFWPIMHVMAVRTELADADPGLCPMLMEMWDASVRESRRWYNDPNCLQFPWARLDVEDQQSAFGAELWPSGIAANRSCLERFVKYSRDQGLISRALDVDALFHESVRAT